MQHPCRALRLQLLLRWRFRGRCRRQESVGSLRWSAQRRALHPTVPPARGLLMRSASWQPRTVSMASPARHTSSSSGFSAWMRSSTERGMLLRASGVNWKVSPRGVRRCLYGLRRSLRVWPACGAGAGVQGSGRRLDSVQGMGISREAGLSSPAGTGLSRWRSAGRLSPACPPTAGSAYQGSAAARAPSPRLRPTEGRAAQGCGGCGAAHALAAAQQASQLLPMSLHPTPCTRNHSHLRVVERGQLRLQGLHARLLARHQGIQLHNLLRHT